VVISNIAAVSREVK